MSFRTVEVEIDGGRVYAKGAEKLPEKGSGLLTIFSELPAAQPKRKRVVTPLVRCKPGSLIAPSPLDLDASLWD